MARSITPGELGRRMRVLGKSFRQHVRAPVDATRRELSQEVRKGFREKNPGRSIFRRRRKGFAAPPLAVSVRSRRGQSPETYAFRLTVKGMAALIEKGGRTKAHRQVPKKAKVLRFEASGGAVFAKQVQHPGSKLPRNPVAERAVKRVAAKLPANLDRSLQRAVTQAGL